jgi:hypothetical protein
MKLLANEFNLVTRKAALGILFLALFPIWLKADECVPVSFSEVAGTTCTIGTFEFSFGNIFGANGTTSNLIGGEYTIQNYWGNSDFEFVPVENGFQLVFTGGAQSITAPENGDAYNNAWLQYSVFDTNVNEWIAGVSVEGGELSASGNCSPQTFVSSSGAAWSLAPNDSWSAPSAGYGIGGAANTWTSVSQADCVTLYHNSQSLSWDSFHSGHQNASPFNLKSYVGSSAYWDGTPTTFTYYTTDTYIPPVPEPNSIILFGSGLAFLAGATRRRRQRRINT